jgi:hypothetical protein
MAEQLRGPFEKFVDSPYYSESELCGGAVTVSFSNKVNPRTLQTVLVCYSRLQPRTRIINTHPHCFGSFHLFLNFPLARKVIVILKCHSSVNFTPVFTHYDETRITDRCSLVHCHYCSHDKHVTVLLTYLLTYLLTSPLRSHWNIGPQQLYNC